MDTNRIWKALRYLMVEKDVEGEERGRSSPVTLDDLNKILEDCTEKDSKKETKYIIIPVENSLGYGVRIYIDAYKSVIVQKGFYTELSDNDLCSMHYKKR